MRIWFVDPLPEKADFRDNLRKLLRHISLVTSYDSFIPGLIQTVLNTSADCVLRLQSSCRLRSVNDESVTVLWSRGS